MGTEVLHPQDVLGERFRVCQPGFNRRRSYLVSGNGFGNEKANNYVHRKQLNHHRPERLDIKRKPTPQQTTDHPNRSSNLQNRQVQSGLEMGRVTVLRRGQSLDSMEKKSESNIMKVKGGILIKKRYNLHGGYGDSLYAGSAFAVSPAPESLPLPSFFSSNNNNNSSSYNKITRDDCDAASRDLKRLLRLE